MGAANSANSNREADRMDARCRPATSRPAYGGQSEFKESLYVPKLPPVDLQAAPEELSILFPLMDVSGSMHNKLDLVKREVCAKFLRRLKPTAIAAMGFTQEQHTFIGFSGISAEKHFREIETAIKSIFIPSNSGTDIPRAVIALLKMIDDFLHPINRVHKKVWQTHCVVITDGIQPSEESEWLNLQKACAVTRERAWKKSCVIFFHLLDLQSTDIDKGFLDRLQSVLEAENVQRAGPQVPEVCDTLSRHMVTLEKCVTELNEVKQEVDAMPSKEHFQLTTLPRFKKVKENVRHHRNAVEAFQPDLNRFEEETRKLLGKGSEVALRYEGAVTAPTEDLQRSLSELEGKIQTRHEEVNQSMQEVRQLMTKKEFTEKLRATRRIESKMSRIENFVSKGSSKELQAEVKEVMEEVQQSYQAVAKFCNDNKDEQFMTRTLQGEVDRSRERAHRLQEQVKDVPEEASHGTLILDFSCSICTEDGTTGFFLSCKSGHSFCVGCLAKHIKVQAENNCPVFCPECQTHQLYEPEVHDICNAAGEPDVAEVYSRRCMQRRVEPQGRTLFCPKACGNAICSRISDYEAVCDQCKHHFCPGCFEQPHPETHDCVLFLQKQIAQTSGAHREKMHGQLRTIELLRKEHTESCPKCKFPCQKVSGCSHVRCAKCQTRFDFGSGRISEADWQDRRAELEVGLDLMTAVDNLSASGSLGGSFASTYSGDGEELSVGRLSASSSSSFWSRPFRLALADS